MWEIIMALLGTLLPALFPGSKEDRSTTSTGNTTGTTSTTIPAWKPKDPGYAMLSPALLSILSQNYGRLSGAGFPGGAGIGNDWISGIVDTLKNAQGDIFKGYNDPATPAVPVAQTPVEKAEEIRKALTRKMLRKS
jgi:hypothetical protein